MKAVLNQNQSRVVSLNQASYRKLPKDDQLIIHSHLYLISSSVFVVSRTLIINFFLKLITAIQQSKNSFTTYYKYNFFVYFITNLCPQSPSYNKNLEVTPLNCAITLNYIILAMQLSNEGLLVINLHELSHIYNNILGKLKMSKGQMYLNKSLFVTSKNGEITDQYILGKQLGKGAYGTVYAAKLKDTGGIRAIKSIKKSSVRFPSTFINQIEILKKLDHPNIIKIYQTYEDANNYYVITELCEGGELFDKLIEKGSFSENDARQIFKQMLYAIKYCHTQKIAHRDLKPQNFLLMNKDSFSLKLIDFGLSYQWNGCMRSELKQKKENKLIGTSYYISPDVLRGDYDQNCDIWSLGVILYILVTAVPPFDGQNDRMILQSVRKGKYTFDIPEMKKVSSSLKDLISKILQPQNKRLSIDQIYQHPWMTMELDRFDLKLNFSKIMNFSKYSKLKTFAVTCIASQMTGKQIQKLGLLFKQIDTDHDGFITTQEMKNALDRQKQFISWPELAQLLNYIDTDRNGKINYNQFIACSLQNSVIIKQQNLKHVFHNLDSNADGKVSTAQLRSAMFRNDFDISEDQLYEIIRKCDKNGDGQIDFKEFLHGVCQM